MREFGEYELRRIKKLWSSGVSDNDLAEMFGRHRGVIRRRMMKEGMPKREIARNAKNQNYTNPTF
jgi:IS30 family transposase